MSSPPPRRVVLFGTSDSDAVTVADILRQETVGGALLLVAAAIAISWAAIDFASYEHLREIHLGPLSLEHWASDGLLAIFFFVAGLELKRELTLGSLSRPSRALVPIVAALCGMVVPAVIYVLINLAPAGHLEGWAIPMATDIAFALAILAVLGRELPTELRALLLTLAIVDDLGGILVIALVFTDSIKISWLLAALACAAAWWGLQRLRVRGWWWWIVLGLACWWCMLQSGVHATIAGVLLGLLTRSELTEHWEHLWRPVSAGAAVPLFALMAAGVPITAATLGGLLGSPVAWGIMIGLIVGKVVGVFGGAYLTARLTRAELAPELRWSDVFAVAVLGGVGFTVALLIAELAFESRPEVADQAKTAVLVASLASAGIAALALRSAQRRRRRTPRANTH